MSHPWWASPNNHPVWASPRHTLILRASCPSPSVFPPVLSLIRSSSCAFCLAQLYYLHKCSCFLIWRCFSHPQWPPWGFYFSSCICVCPVKMFFATLRVSPLKRNSNQTMFLSSSTLILLLFSSFQRIRSFICSSSPLGSVPSHAPRPRLLSFVLSRYIFLS